jgi:hypothetical protein
MAHPTLRALAVALFFGVMTASCGNDTTTTTPTTTETVRGTETFNGTLGIGQSQFYSFTTVSPGTTDVTLISTRPAGSITSTLNTVMGLGLGTPQGVDCALSSATTTASGLKSQLTATTNISVYCVKIADVGNLTGSVDYTVRIVHP